MAGQQYKPGPDNTQLETRLLVVAEMLERAVAEVHRAMDEIKSGEGPAIPPAVTPSQEERQEPDGTQ